MQFHKTKNNQKIPNQSEKSKMTNIIQSDEINNVCFECGTNNPEYISINNAVFICKECVQDHFQFPHEISQIIINDLTNLNISDIKRLFLGGNKRLIEFINFDFPRLKQFPPNILYKTRAVDYYRKRLDFFVQGGIRPLKPIFEYAYQMINIPNKNFNISNYKKDIYLSPKVNLVNERYSSTTKLTPISEANQNEDENNNSEYSENKENNEQDNINKEKNNNEKKEENNIIYSPKKPRYANIHNDIHNNLHNNSAFISPKIYNNKSFENNHIIKNLVLENNITPKTRLYKKQVIYNNKNNSNTKEKKSEDISMNANLDNDKNISDFMKLNNYEKSITNINDDIYGDDNTIKSINKYMNNSKESDFYNIKNNKEKDIIINNNINYDGNENKNIEVNHQKEEKESYIDNSKNNEEKDEEENNIISNISATKNNKKEINKNMINNSNENDKIIDRVTKTKKIEIITMNDSNKDDTQKKINNNKIEAENKNKTINYRLKDIKDTNVIYPKNLDNFSEKENSKKKHLKAKISTKKMPNTEYDEDNFEEIYPSYESKRIVPYKNEKDDFFKNEKNDIFQFDDDIFTKDKKDNFYSESSGSNFINPLKYLKRSFQKKQEEKFGYDSEENSSSEKDELENNNSIKIIDHISGSDMIKDEKNINDKNINNGYKEINRRTRNSIGKEGDTKESTESQQEDKNLSIRQRYKNRNKY